MSLPPGLPPLPKSLCSSRNSSGFTNHNQSDNVASTSSSSSSKETSSEISDQNGSLSLDTGNSNNVSTTTLDKQLAILRREMYSLRQLDLSLLSQLWTLNESIQSFRSILQEQENLSPPSPTPSYSDTNSISSDLEDDSSIAPQLPPQPQMNNISPPKMMGKNAHPQLPQILQQRMRRRLDAPPPPPPSRKPPQKPL